MELPPNILLNHFLSNPKTQAQHLLSLNSWFRFLKNHFGLGLFSFNLLILLAALLLKKSSHQFKHCYKSINFSLLLQDFQIMGKAGKIVRLVRVMRIMRIFKLVRHFAGLQSLIYTLNQAYKELGLLMLLVGVAVLTFSR